MRRLIAGATLAGALFAPPADRADGANSYSDNTGKSYFIWGNCASLSGQVSVSASVTETTIVTYTMEANSPQVGSNFIFEAFGTYDNPSDTSPTACTFKIKIGATQIVAVSATPPASTAQTNKGWHVRGLIAVRTTGSSGTCAASADLAFNAGATTANISNVAAPSATQTWNTTTTNAITLTMTLGEATSGYVCRAETGYIQRLNI